MLSCPKPALATRTLCVLVLGLVCLPWLAAWSAEEPAAGSPAFDILEYRVGGNTVLAPLAIEQAVYPHLGPGRTIADVEAARQAVEKAYRDAGYQTVFVDIPEQDVSGSGVVRLNVTEGRIERVRVTGARYFANGWIREQIPEVQSGRIPRLDEFQSQLRTLNRRSPDRQVDPILRPGSVPGAVEVELKVRDELPLHGSLEVNNRNTAGTTDSRLSASLRYDNLFQRDHSLSFQYQVSPEDRAESEVLAASYVIRPESSRTSFVLYAVDSSSDIATLGGDITVQGPGNVYGARAVLPLPSREGFFQNLTLGADYKDFEEIIGFAEQGEDDIRTPISYLMWSAAWAGSLLAEGRSQSFNAGLNFATRGLGNEPGEFEDKRFMARPNFVYLTGGYSLLQQLPADRSLYFRLGLQLTAQPLVSNEQLNAGGLDTVRGYYEAEELGDYGATSTLELQSRNYGPALWKELESLQFYVFADAATLRIHDPLPGNPAADRPREEDGISIYSTGFGARFTTAGLTADLDWALPLEDASATSSGDDRILFRFQYGF